MNRQERLSIWTDEVAHPGSSTTWAAMQASGADLQLVEEWRDLVGEPGECGSTWMTYFDFLKGAIGLTADHDPKTEFDTPNEQIHRFIHIVNLWYELGKATDTPRNEMGEDVQEYELWKNRHDDGGPMHGDFVEYPDSQPVKYLTTMVELPGRLHVRYRVEDRTFLGFGFTPINDANPGFKYIAGPELPFDPNQQGNPLWDGLRDYLHNVHEISGEWTIAVEWTEDGYDTHETGELQ